MGSSVSDWVDDVAEAVVTFDDDTCLGLRLAAAGT
jgi:hypothetical protein